MAALARTIQIGIVAALGVLSVAPVSAQPETPSSAGPNAPVSTLLRYSFDDNLLEAGPDTFSIFQHGTGTVSLSSVHRYSGYRSVELRDAVGDKAFPELQGYFPLRAKGQLYLHFALMTADPAEELNIALAGPQWFNLRKDGIGFWLKTVDGYLTAISDSMPKKLFAMRPFVWYIVDVTYAIDAGTYDMTIREDGLAAPLVEVRGAPNAPNQAGSRVDKFSFIGDHDTDASKVVYYVDDVLVGIDEAIVQQPFVAPGRRKLFVDYWNEAKKASAARPGLPPLMSLDDLGIGPSELAALKQDQGLDALVEILSNKRGTSPAGLAPRSQAVLETALAWQLGSAAFHEGNAALAQARFDRALELTPSATLPAIGAVMALAHLAQWQEMERRLNRIVPIWRNDPRLPAVLARVGLARGDLDAVERQLRYAAQATGFLAEEYFLALLWKGDSVRAEQFAQARAASHGASERTLWNERLADAAFLNGDTQRARDLYEANLASHPRAASIWLKLSDVYFKLGDREKERAFRERVYGGLTGR